MFSFLASWTQIFKVSHPSAMWYWFMPYAHLNFILILIWNNFWYFSHILQFCDFIYSFQVCLDQIFDISLLSADLILSSWHIYHSPPSLTSALMILIQFSLSIQCLSPWFIRDIFIWFIFWTQMAYRRFEIFRIRWDPRCDDSSDQRWKLYICLSYYSILNKHKFSS